MGDAEGRIQALEELRVWGTALVSALPILGGPFSVLMTEYLPSVRLQRLDEMLRWIRTKSG